jgi:hypothetical protein
MAKRRGKILIEEIAQKFAYSIIRPAAVNKQQTFQVAKLSDGKVTSQYSLLTLLAAYAYANMSRFKKKEITILEH